MQDYDYSLEAVAWVNLLVPGHFNDAEKFISSECRYTYKGESLSGPSIIRAFVESHVKASRELDSIEYLPGVPIEIGPDGALIAVADKISLNGKSHIYNDRLLVKMEKVGLEWKVIRIQHLPIANEQTHAQDFLDSMRRIKPLL